MKFTGNQLLLREGESILSEAKMSIKSYQEFMITTEGIQ